MSSLTQRKKEKEKFVSHCQSVFCRRMVELRKENGNITQEALAYELGISKSTIQKYETSERKPNSFDLMWIADYFNVSTNYLLGKTDVKRDEHTNLDDLGLTDESIDNLKTMNKMMYGKHRLETQAFLYLDTLNLLIKKKNTNLLYLIGDLLLIKRAYENHYKKINNDKNVEAFDSYQFLIFRIEKEIETFMKNNYNKALNEQIVKNIDYNGNIEKALGDIYGIEQYYIDELANRLNAKIPL